MVNVKLWITQSRKCSSLIVAQVNKFSNWVREWLSLKFLIYLPLEISGKKKKVGSFVIKRERGLLDLRPNALLTPFVWYSSFTFMGDSILLTIRSKGFEFRKS